MGLVEPNRLAEPDLAEPICTASHGVTGNFKRILHWSAKVAKAMVAASLGATISTMR
jgi:hypothetical protein